MKIVIYDQDGKEIDSHYGYIIHLSISKDYTTNAPIKYFYRYENYKREEFVLDTDFTDSIKNEITEEFNHRMPKGV